jgi:hypothetical protein
MSGGQAQDGVACQPGRQGIGFVSLAPEFQYAPLGLVRALGDPLATEPGDEYAGRLCRGSRACLSQERHEWPAVLDNVVRKRFAPQLRQRSPTTATAAA